MPSSDIIRIAQKTESLLTQSGEKFVKGLQDQFDINNLNDTQKAKKSLSFTVKGNKLTIEGLLRVIVLVTGRKPGKFPPIDVIDRWVQRKLGIPASESKSVAFLIARKIAREGTNIFTGKSKGLELELVLDEINKELFKDVSNQLGLVITETIADAYK